MPAQDRLDGFNDDKARADGIRQSAHAAAHQKFRERVEAERAAQVARRTAAEQRFDRVRSRPLHPDHTPARRELEQAEVPLHHREANADLDREIRDADDAYRAAVRAAAAKHGVLTDVPAR